MVHQKADESHADHDRPDAFVIAGLLTLLPTQCGTDGVLYRRQTSAEQAAAAYEAAVRALRPQARLVWAAMPPAATAPSGVRPVNPAVNKTRLGLTLTAGMNPRPCSTGFSARTFWRSIGFSSMLWF